MAISELALALLVAAGNPEGARIYRGACAPCHGERGDGRGPAAHYLDPAPRDFTAGVFKFRSTASGSAPLREDVLRTVARGIPGSFMPAWQGRLDDAQLAAVVDYVLAFSPPPEEPQVLVPAQTAEAPGDLARGHELYVRMGCGECHGALGRGDGPAVPTLVDDGGRPLRPLDFTIGLYKGGSSPIDIYRTFVTGLSGTPMPSYGDAMPDPRDRWALVHYVRSLSRRRGVWLYLFGPHTPWQ